GETVVALIVLVGGLALVGATLMLSVWSWRRARAAPAAPTPSPDPSSDPFPDPPLEPLPDPSSDPQEAAPDPPDDNTRIYWGTEATRHGAEDSVRAGHRTS